MARQGGIGGFGRDQIDAGKGFWGAPASSPAGPMNVPKGRGRPARGLNPDAVHRMRESWGSLGTSPNAPGYNLTSPQNQPSKPGTDLVLWQPPGQESNLNRDIALQKTPGTDLVPWQQPGSPAVRPSTDLVLRTPRVPALQRRGGPPATRTKPGGLATITSDPTNPSAPTKPEQPNNPGPPRSPWWNDVPAAAAVGLWAIGGNREMNFGLSEEGQRVWSKPGALDPNERATNRIRLKNGLTTQTSQYSPMPVQRAPRQAVSGQTSPMFPMQHEDQALLHPMAAADNLHAWTTGVGPGAMHSNVVRSPGTYADPHLRTTSGKVPFPELQTVQPLSPPGSVQAFKR